MDKKILMDRLKEKPDLDQFIAEVIDDSTILHLLFDIVLTEKSGIKYKCTRIIRMVSEQKPELIYPNFYSVRKWLYHNNSFIKWDGILTLSNLAAVDFEDRFKEIYQDYFALIRDPHMITAGNVIGNAWKIVLARPELESDITGRLLEVPDITYLNDGELSPECNRIACGHVLECFDRYFDFSGNKSAMINFAKEQLESSRKSVVKCAERFLKRHSG